jgi:hypothetical protein
MEGFDRQLRADAHAAIEEAGEWIQFFPWQQAPLRIKAIVDREPASSPRGLKGASVYKHEIRIERSECHGVMQINLGNDYVSFAGRIGGQVEKFKVMKVFGPQDAGMWHLGVG